MRKNVNNSFTLASSNKHLLDIFEDDYYIELGNIKINVINKILKGEQTSLSEIVYLDILANGVGRITDDYAIDPEVQLNFLFSLRQKRSTDKFVITCGVAHYYNYNDIEIFAPIVLLPVMIDFNTKEVYLDGAVWINRLLLDSLYNKKGNADEGNKKKIQDLVFAAKKCQTVLDIDNLCNRVKDVFDIHISTENYLTTIDVAYLDFSVKEDFLTTQRSIYETNYYDIEKNFYKNISPVFPTNIEQKYIMNKVSQKESFVVNGKLGSGKTTTIVNIIADAIKHKKRVLYLNQSIKGIIEVKTILKKLKFDRFQYDLCPIAFGVGEVDPILGTKSEIAMDSIIDDIYKEDKIYETKHHGYPYNYIIEKIALENALGHTEVIPIEKPLERHETEHIYKSLKIIEENLKQVDKFPENPWACLLSSKNAPKVDEIVERTKKFYNIHKRLITSLEKASKFYGFKPAIDINDFNHLNEELLSLFQIPPLKCWHKGSFYEEASKALAQIAKLADEFYSSKEYYKEKCIENYQSGEASKQFKIITNKRYDIKDPSSKDIKYIDKLLQDPEFLHQFIDTLTAFNKTYFKYFDQLKIYFDIDEETNELFKNLKIFEEYLQFNSPISDWIIEYLTSPRDFINKGKEYIELYNTTKDAFTRVAPYIHTEDIDFQILKQMSQSRLFNHQLRRVIRKDALRKDKMSVAQIAKIISEYLNYGDILTSVVPGIKQFAKSENGWNNYYQFISFISSLDRTGIKLFNSLVQKMTKNKQLTYKDLYNALKDVNKNEAQIESYERVFNDYHIAVGGATPIDVVRSYVDVLPYLKKASLAVDKLLSFFKNPENVTTIDIIVLCEIDNVYLECIESFEKNAEYYTSLFGDAYLKQNTDTPLIGKTIDYFFSFLDRCDGDELAIKILTKDTPEHTSKAYEDLRKQYQEFARLYSDWYTGLRGFSTCFFGGMMAVQNYSLEYNLQFIKGYINKLEQVELVAEIESELDIHYNYGLKNLPKGIQEGIYAEGIADRFLYSMMKLYEKERLDEGYVPFNINKYRYLVDTYVNNELEVCQNNLYRLQNSKLENHSMLKVNSVIDPAGYFDDCEPHHLIFLGDLNFLNNITDLNMFDLVLVDDAHISLSSNYNLITKANQIVIFGDKRFQSSISNFLLQRLPQDSFIRLHQRYALYTTLFNNTWSKNNQFLYTSLIKTSYAKYTNIELFANEVVTNFKENKKKINILVGQLSSMRTIYGLIVKKLSVDYAIADVLLIMNNLIHILIAPTDQFRNGESATTADGIYIWVEDFTQIDDNIKDGIMKNYIQGNEFIKLCFLDHGSEDNEKIEIQIKKAVGSAHSRSIILQGITSMLYDKLLEANVQPEKGIGSIDIIIKTKTKLFGIVVLGKRTVVNYSALDNYIFYVNEYRKIGWNILVYSMEEMADRFEEIYQEIITKVGIANDYE